MSLKSILKGFLNNFEIAERQRLQGNDIYELQFKKLKELSEQLKTNADYSCSQGECEVNRRKNRYKDILPFDHSRVILSEYPGVPGSDYINASYIKGASGSLAYIACQGPLPNTLVDFWRMLWETEVHVIVMVCNEKESGKYKCECYWPQEGEKRQYGNITIELVKWRVVCPDFLVRTLHARWVGEGEEAERTLCQFHYGTWPDHGVPTSVEPILELVRLMRDCQPSEALPILIHCSAGCGRTGTLCAIDYVWTLMKLGKLTPSFNLFDITADMRRQRIAMVQTKDQYILVHKAVAAMFEQQLHVIDSHTYENLDSDGVPLLLRNYQDDELIYEEVIDLNTSQENSENKGSTADIPIVSSTDSLNNDSGSESGHLSRRGSKTLRKLRQEESVKRLISGWLKTVEKYSLPQHVPSRHSSSPKSNQKDNLSKKHDGSRSSEEKSPPKLVGKATVIRRPSIAKLKALFEKSLPNEVDVPSPEYSQPPEVAPHSLVNLASRLERSRSGMLAYVSKKLKPPSSLRSEQEETVGSRQVYAEVLACDAHPETNDHKYSNKKATRSYPHQKTRYLKPPPSQIPAEMEHTQESKMKKPVVESKETSIKGLPNGSKSALKPSNSRGDIDPRRHDSSKKNKIRIPERLDNSPINKTHPKYIEAMCSEPISYSQILPPKNFVSPVDKPRSKEIAGESKSKFALSTDHYPEVKSCVPSREPSLTGHPEDQLKMSNLSKPKSERNYSFRKSLKGPEIYNAIKTGSKKPPIYDSLPSPSRQPVKKSGMFTVDLLQAIDSHLSSKFHKPSAASRREAAPPGSGPIYERLPLQSTLEAEKAIYGETPREYQCKYGSRETKKSCLRREKSLPNYEALYSHVSKSPPRYSKERPRTLVAPHKLPASNIPSCKSQQSALPMKSTSGPPKPPRTFHHSSSMVKAKSHSNLDGGGRFIVPVASPKYPPQGAEAAPPSQIPTLRTSSSYSPSKANFTHCQETLSKRMKDVSLYATVRVPSSSSHYSSINSQLFVPPEDNYGHIAYSSGDDYQRVKDDMDLLPSKNTQSRRSMVEQPKWEEEEGKDLAYSSYFCLTRNVSSNNIQVEQWTQV